MELLGSNIKEFYKTGTAKKIHYISGKGNLKKVRYISGNGTFSYFKR